MYFDKLLPLMMQERNTPLGRELHLDLLMVFMGLWDQWEIPMILEDHGLIDDLDRRDVEVFSRSKLSAASIMVSRRPVSAP
jgi:hypothetical protein